MSDEPKRATKNNRQMTTEAAKVEEHPLFFFPKANPPISIRAASREDAEAILETNRKEV